MAILKTEAIVLKRSDFRETSVIASFFTQDYGKISCLFKGIRKEAKKFASNLELFSLNELIFYKSNKSDLNLASQCDCLESFDSLRKDLNKVYAASFMLGLVDSLMQLEEASLPTFTLLKDCLDAMRKERDWLKVIFIFQIKMLSLSGFQPHIDSCLACQEHVSYSDKVYFSSAKGGLLCQKCKNIDRAARLTYKGTIASLSFIQKNNLDANLRLGLNKLIKNELSYLLRTFLQYHLEKELKPLSASFAGR